MTDHQRVKDLLNQGRPDEATKLVMDLIDINPDDGVALTQLGAILLNENRKGLAHNVFARACKQLPDSPDVWMGFSKTYKDSPENWKKIEWCLNKSRTLCNKQGVSIAPSMANLAMLQYIKGDYEKAQNSVSTALKLEPKNKNAVVTQGFIHLAKGNWAEAWKMYDVMLETGRRESYSYGDESEWDGSPSKRLIISGEQGIGDEIMYASCFQEVIDDCSHVVIECMPKLRNLFQRSFPQAKVYGTRWDKEVFWDEDHSPEAHIAMASIPRFYRNADKDFPGRPYLTPDPWVISAVDGLLDSLDGPKIGIAWTGGTDRTRGHLRDRTLEELTPILRQDATFISLEYNDRSKEINQYFEKRGVSIQSFPWLTGTKCDYDLTAALISQLDLVISVPTTAVQTAGALGVPCWVMVPRYTGWIFAQDKYPWADSVTPLKNTSMKDIAGSLSSWLSLFNTTDIKAVG